MSIRLATPSDVPEIVRVVDAAYSPYIPRMRRKPGPMLDDYPARVQSGTAWVFDADGALAGLLVLLDGADHLLLENIAVDPVHHGTGVGRALLQFTEAEAVRRGYSEVQLYTHQTMTENIALYLRIGYRETGRRTHEGFRRVFFAKPVGEQQGREIAG
jgi:ribosomal protein S18 acetylase RimI-like enzyme